VKSGSRVGLSETRRSRLRGRFAREKPIIAHQLPWFAAKIESPEIAQLVCPQMLFAISSLSGNSSSVSLVAIACTGVNLAFPTLHLARRMTQAGCSNHHFTARP
jgi:hypothetical protein